MTVAAPPLAELFPSPSLRERVGVRVPSAWDPERSDQGKRLSGASKYVMRFPKGEAPPTNGFRPVTMLAFTVRHETQISPIPPFPKRGGISRFLFAKKGGVGACAPFMKGG